MNVSEFQFVSISADLLHLSKYLLLKISSILCDFVGFFFYTCAPGTRVNLSCVLRCLVIASSYTPRCDVDP